MKRMVDKKDVVSTVNTAIDEGEIVAGTSVEANPTLEGGESALTGIEIDGTKYAIVSESGGKWVEITGLSFSTTSWQSSEGGYPIFGLSTAVFGKTSTFGSLLAGKILTFSSHPTSTNEAPCIGIGLGTTPGNDYTLTRTFVRLTSSYTSNAPTKIYYWEDSEN